MEKGTNYEVEEKGRKIPSHFKRFNVFINATSTTTPIFPETPKTFKWLYNLTLLIIMNQQIYFHSIAFKKINWLIYIQTCMYIYIHNIKRNYSTLPTKTFLKA